MSTARKLVQDLTAGSVKLPENGDNVVLAYFKQQGSLALQSADELGPLCEKAIEALPSEAEAVKKGKVKAVERIVGQVMKLARGRADANAARSMLLKMLEQQ